MHCVSTILADRTRLELATPCVTGMYSNQTELPIRLSFLTVQKYTFFQLNDCFCEFFSILFYFAELQRFIHID